MRRPLLPVGLFYVAGILLSDLFFVSPIFLLVSGLGLALMTLLCGRARPWLLFALIVLTGWSNVALRTAILSPHDLRILIGDVPGLATIRGTLRETPTLRVFEHDDKPSWRTMAQLNVTAIRMAHQPWRQADGKIAVT